MYLALEGPSSSRGDCVVPKAQGGVSRAPSSAGRGASLEGLHEGKAVSDGIRRRDPGERGGCFENTPGGGLLGDERKKDTAVGVASGWRRGPVDPAGHVSFLAATPDFDFGPFDDDGRCVMFSCCADTCWFCSSAHYVSFFVLACMPKYVIG